MTFVLLTKVSMESMDQWLRITQKACQKYTSVHPSAKSQKPHLCW